MRKQLLFIASLALGLLNVCAQESGDFELGGNIGLNLANVSSIDGQDNASTRIAFNVGASGEYYFSDRWGLKMKIIYDGKGWSDGFIIDEDSNTTITDFELTYITIPVMANWHFGSNRNWYLNFGPYVGILVSAEDSELGMDVKDAFSGTDIGLALGIGYKFNISNNTSLYVEYDGQSGFTDVFEENLGDTVRNGRSSLNLGVLFSL